MKYDNMPAGRKMDALVAEKAMGHSVHRDSNGFIMPPEWGGPQFYSMEIDDAWMVVEKMVNHPDQEVYLRFQQEIASQNWCAPAYLMCLRICRAALKAIAERSYVQE